MHGITPFLTLQFSSVQEGIYMLVKASSVLLPITQKFSMLTALEAVLILTEYRTPFCSVPVEVKRLHYTSFPLSVHCVFLLSLNTVQISSLFNSLLYTSCSLCLHSRPLVNYSTYLFLPLNTAQHSFSLKYSALLFSFWQHYTLLFPFLYVHYTFLCSVVQWMQKRRSPNWELRAAKGSFFPF